MPISHSPCRRRSKGPLPSCLVISVDPVEGVQGINLTPLVKNSLCSLLIMASRKRGITCNSFVSLLSVVSSEQKMMMASMIN